MAPKSTIILSAVLCALILTVSTKAQTKSHNVSTGMEVEDALMIAKRCVIAATNFVNPNRRLYKEIRPQDSLEYAGISDAIRLNSLRRYVVRNADIGVQSVWGTKVGHTDPVPYLISNSALADISRSWTLEKLASEIMKNSGLPYLTNGHARSVVAGCRKKILKLTTPISTDTRISLEAPPGPIMQEFERCLTGDGVLPGVGITTGEGDFYPYTVHDPANEISGRILGGTYKELIGLIEKKAYILFPPDILAPRMFLTALLSSRSYECNERSFHFSTLCGLYDMKRSTVLDDITPNRAGFNSSLNNFPQKYKRKQTTRPKNTPNNLSNTVGGQPAWQIVRDMEGILKK